MDNEFLLELIGTLQQKKSQKQLNSDIKQLEKILNMVRLTGTFAKGNTKKELNAYINQLSGQLSTIKLKGKIDSRNLKAETDKALSSISFKDIDILNINESKAKLKVKKVIADAKAYAEKTPITVNIESKRNKLNNDLTAYLNRNTKINESGALLKEADKVRELIDAVADRKSLREATDAFQLYKSEVSATGFNTKSTTDKIKGMFSQVTKIGSALGLASLATNKFRQSLSTLKTNDTILTEISKTSEMTKNQLKELGDEAFKVASKYGQVSGNYLTAVQEMARSGYEMTLKELGELSLLAQSAGDMTAEMANNYILATDAAYKYGGSVESLNAALDGANYISNKNSASLTDIADATRVSASFAANAGVAIDELTAAEATMIAATKRSGSEMGRAFRSILLNIQQVSGEFDGEVIDEESLKKVEERCHSLGVELEYMKDGVATLRNPMEVLKDLAEVYNSLPDNSAEKQGLISDIGGKYHANGLSALLSRWDMYEKMLGEFSQGTGSALEEANKTADSWEGRLNSLSNSFDSFVNTLTNKGAVLNGITFFDRLIQGGEALTDTLGAIPVALTTLNTVMTAVNKNYGITKIWDKEQGKFSIEGNMLGINFSQIKNMKKHFSEAEIAIRNWNGELVNGVTDITSFNNATVKNNAQLKSYLATTSTDAPASLEGYKSHLREAGIQTDALRLKTVLLNSAITMGLSLGIQAVVSIINSCATASDRLLESASKLGSQFSSTQSDIENYKIKIDDLYKTINDDSSSYEDTYNARMELLSIQDEMIEKFGSEAEAVKLVTDAINGQTDALNTLTEQEWQEVKNEFISGSDKKWHERIGDAWANLWSGSTDNFDRMKKEMEDAEVTFFIDPQFSSYEEFQKKLQEIFKVEKDEQRFLPRDFEDAIGAQKGASFTLSGDLDDIYDKLINIQSLAENMGIDDKFLKDLSEQADKAKEKLEGYNEFYNKSVLYDKINNNETYKNSFDEIAKEYKKYQNIFASGDEGAIAKARQSYAEIVRKATEGIDDQSVIDYFNNMYPELRDIVGNWEFEVDFKAAVNDDENGFETDVKNAIDSFDTSDDILEFNAKTATDEQIDDYTELQIIADKYNLTLNELIDKMVKMGLIASQAKQDLMDKLISNRQETSVGIGSILSNAINNINPDVAKEWINSLSEEDAMTANSKEFEEALERQKEELNGAALSADNYNTALEEIKSNQNGTGAPPISSFTDAWASLDTTEDDNLKSLKEDLLSLAEAGQLTLEKFINTTGSDSFLSMLGIESNDTQEITSLISQINELKSSADQLSSMKKGISSLSENLYSREQEPDAAIDADVLAGMDSALKEQTEEWEKYVTVLGDASSSMDDVQKATDDLASAYVNSNNFLVNLTEANKDYYVSQLDAMGVANSAEIVEERVNAQKEVAEYKTQALSIAIKDLADSQASYTQRSVDSVNATYENSRAFLEQSNMSDLAKVSLVNLIAQEQIYNSTTLSTSQKVNELNKLALAFLGVGKAVQISSAMGGDSRYWTSPEQYDAAVKEQFNNSMTNWANSITTVRTKPATTKNKSNDKSGSSKDAKDAKEETIKEFSEVFDWIERRIRKFQRSFDKWVKQAETAVTTSFVNKYYKKAQSSAKSQLSTYGKAYNRYMKEANAVGLEEKYARKVRNGTIDIEEIRAKGSEEEVKKYEELAEKIKEYQDWYIYYALLSGNR